MIKKRTRPQPRLRNRSLDPSDSASTDAQQQQQLTNNEDEAGLPYVSALTPAVSPNVYPSATVSPSSSSFVNFAVHAKALMHPS